MNNAGITAIGFYFQQLRDYVVAFKVYRFNTMSQERLRDEFEQVNELGARADLFTLYYRLASPEHKIVLDRDVRENATNYLIIYKSIIRQHFPSLREIFNPRTGGRVGFIGELLIVNRHLGGYGFRPLGETDDEVHFVPVQAAIGKSNLSYLDGADQLHFTGSSRGFRDGIDVSAEVIDHELLPQLENFLKEGILNESQCPEMLTEFIVETILQNKEIFNELLDDRGRHVKYPIELDRIQKLLLHEKLIRHYRDDIISTKRQIGEIEEIWDGGIVKYSIQLSKEDEEKVSDAVANSLSSGRLPKFRARYAELDALESSLVNAINRLRLTHTKIGGPLFNDESKLKGDVSRGQSVASDSAKKYLHWLYSAFLENYKYIIETNFPSLKEHFNLYSTLPVQVHLVLGRTVEHAFGHDRTSLEEYFSPSQSGANEVKVVEDLILDLGDHSSINVGGEVFRTSFWCHRSFESLFSSRSGRINDPFRGMTLRRLVYRTIENEWKSVRKQIRPLLKRVSIPSV